MRWPHLLDDREGAKSSGRVLGRRKSHGVRESQPHPFGIMGVEVSPIVLR
jgi:hypothetical protein